MYAHEDRLRAVRLYIKLGKRMGLTIRQLGYPTKNALKGWYREYEQRRELHAVYARPPKYSTPQKEQAVKHFLDNGRCIALTVKSLGYPSRSLLSSWIRQLCPEVEVRVVGRSPELSAEAKQSAVIALCMREASAKSVAQGVGVSRPSLYNWKNQLLGHDAPSSMKRQPDSMPSPERNVLEQQLHELRREVKRLQLEQDILKKANELLKKDLGIDQRLLTNREKTQLVDALRSNHSLSHLLRQIDLPRSSYFYHRARLQAVDKYTEVRRAMADIFERNYRCYASPSCFIRRRTGAVASTSAQHRHATLLRDLVQRGVHSAIVFTACLPISARSVRPQTTCLTATSARALPTRSGSPTSPNSRSQPVRSTSRQ
jgi:transposase-like protein